MESIEIDGKLFGLPFADTLPALTEMEYAALVEDVRGRGVLVPIVIDENSDVIDGQHRLRAAAAVGLSIKDIPFDIRIGLSDDEKLELGEDLNLHRRHLSKDQLTVVIFNKRKRGKSLRQIAAETGVSPATALRALSTVSFETVDLPETIMGKDGRERPATMPKHALVDAPRLNDLARLERDSPALVQRIADGEIGVYDALRQMKREQAKSDKQELTLKEATQGRFQVIYADPPWSYNNSGLNGSAASHYPTMTTDDIAAMPVSSYATSNAVLFMWATNPLLEDAMQVLKGWNFAYKTNFVWVKDRGAYGKLGFYNYGRHELLLIATRGSCVPSIETLPDSVITADKSRHSAKPDEFYELIERMYPGPYLELFARNRRDGWSVWGNETEEEVA